MEGSGSDPLPVCATCGAVAADPVIARLTWSRGTEGRGAERDVWVCDACSRRHLRSIEGKLDSSWW